jgi:hypothetical protein
MAVARRDIKKRVGSAKPRATWENVIRKRDVGGCQKGKVSCFFQGELLIGITYLLVTYRGQSNMLMLPLVVFEDGGRLVEKIRNDDMFMELGSAGGIDLYHADDLWVEELRVGVVEANYFLSDSIWRLE